MGQEDRSMTFSRSGLLCSCVGVIVTGAILAYGLFTIVGQSPLGVCNVQPTAANGNVSARAVCKSWQHEGGTSWALKFTGDVVHWNGKTNLCQEFIAVRFAGELDSEAACKKRAQEIAAMNHAYDRCVLDEARQQCYVECSCREKNRRYSEVFGWLFLVIGSLGLLFSILFFVAYGLKLQRGPSFGEFPSTGGEVHSQARTKSEVVTEELIEQLFPEGHLTGNPQCVVCLSPVLETEMGRQLKCNHSFHGTCILSWWMHRPCTSLECPLCKQVQYSPKEQHPPTSSDGQLHGQTVGATDDAIVQEASV